MRQEDEGNGRDMQEQMREFMAGGNPLLNIVYRLVKLRIIAQQRKLLLFILWL